VGKLRSKKDSKGSQKLPLSLFKQKIKVMTKQQMLAQLSEAQALTSPEVALPISFVIKMVESLEEPQVSTKITIHEGQMNDLVNSISEGITDAGLDLVDDYELSMSYREVELDSIDYDSDRIERSVKDAIKYWLDSVNDSDDNN
jgi:hypothetical protein